MTSFALTPRIPNPQPAAPFPVGIQFQENGSDVGPPNPQFVSLNGDVVGTYDPDTGTANFDISTASGGGGGGGATSIVAFSASLTIDQTSGGVLKCDNVSTNRGNDYAGYNPATGVLTILGGDAGMWMFGGMCEMQSGNEVVNVERELTLVINSGTFGTSGPVTFQSSEQWSLQVTSGPVRVVAADQIWLAPNSAFAGGPSGVSAIGLPDTRFWAVRLSD